MIAMRIPKDIADKLDKENEDGEEDLEFFMRLKDEWFIDYKGECL